jgi:fluoride exporter
MTAAVVLTTLAAGAVGAVARYGVTLLIARTGRPFPWAVLIVNVVGSFVGGVVIGLVETAAIGADLRLIVLSGFAGGLTTFSTFSVETVQLTLSGKWRSALLSVGLNLVLGVAAVVVGFAVAGGFR